jgi:hypothetical protein
MRQNWNALPKPTVVKRPRHLQLGWKLLYTRIIGAAVSLLVLLALEFFL